MTRRLLMSYLLGLAAIVVGAWVTGITGSFFPLALGASFGVMQTVATVIAIIARRRQRTKPP